MDSTNASHIDCGIYHEFSNLQDPENGTFYADWFTLLQLSPATDGDTLEFFVLSENVAAYPSLGSYGIIGLCT